MSKRGPIKQLSFQTEHQLICFSSLNNAELPLSDHDKKGSRHLRQINQPQHTVFTSGTSHMTDHPRNSCLKPVRQIRDKKRERPLSKIRKVAAKQLLAEKREHNAELWAFANIRLSLGHIRFYLLCAPPCGWLWWGYAPENVFCDLHPLIRVGDAAPCGQLDRSERWASADLWHDRKKNTLQQ